MATNAPVSPGSYIRLSAIVWLVNERGWEWWRGYAGQPLLRNPHGVLFRVHGPPHGSRYLITRYSPPSSYYADAD